MAILRQTQTGAAVGKGDGQAAGPDTRVFVHESGAAVVFLAGDVDLASAPAMTREVEALLARPINSLTVDMSDLTFMDSAGLLMLNAFRKQTEERGIPLALRSVPRFVQRILDITEMTTQFTIDPPFTDTRPTFIEGFD